MAQFTKHNNPSKKRRKARPMTEYQQEMRDMYWHEIAKCSTDSQRDMIAKAYRIMGR